MEPNILLTLMIAAYAVPISVVYYKYLCSDTGSRSISSIITSQEPFFVATDAPPHPDATVFIFQTRYFIAACMLLMAGFTIAYEYQRPRWSLFAVIAIIIGIFGVIFIPEHKPIHYLFAATVFFAILGFMVAHTYYGTDDATITDNLRILLYAQFLFMVVTVIGVIQDTPIFMIESLIVSCNVMLCFVFFNPSFQTSFTTFEYFTGIYK